MTTDSFKKHIIPLQSYMQTLAERMLGDAMEAEDVVQEVFMRMWEHRDVLSKVVNIKSYVMQATRMRCIDIIRKRDKGCYKINDNFSYFDEETITDSKISEEVELVERRSAMLHSMLDNLPEKQRKIVTMRYIEEKEIHEIEETMKMSSSNVYTTLSRAIQTLRTKLQYENER